MVADVLVASFVVPGPRLLRPRDGFGVMPISHHGTRSMNGHCMAVMAPSPQYRASGYEARMVVRTDFLWMVGIEQDVTRQQTVTLVYTTLNFCACIPDSLCSISNHPCALLHVFAISAAMPPSWTSGNSYILVYMNLRNQLHIHRYTNWYSTHGPGDYLRNCRLGPVQQECLARTQSQHRMAGKGSTLTSFVSSSSTEASESSSRLAPSKSCLHLQWSTH